MPLKLFQRVGDRQAGDAQLSKLVIEFCPSRELAGCENNAGRRHGLKPAIRKPHCLPCPTLAEANQATAPSIKDLIFALPPAMPTC